MKISFKPLNTLVQNRRLAKSMPDTWVYQDEFDGPSREMSENMLRTVKVAIAEGASPNARKHAFVGYGDADVKTSRSVLSIATRHPAVFDALMDAGATVDRDTVESVYRQINILNFEASMYPGDGYMKQIPSALHHALQKIAPHLDKSFGSVEVNSMARKLGAFIEDVMPRLPVLPAPQEDLAQRSSAKV